MMERLVESMATMQSRLSGSDNGGSPSPRLPRKVTFSDDDSSSSDSDDSDKMSRATAFEAASDGAISEELAQFLKLEAWPGQGVRKMYSKVAVKAGEEFEPLSDFGFTGFSAASKQFRKDKESTLEWQLRIPLREFVL